MSTVTASSESRRSTSTQEQTTPLATRTHSNLASTSSTRSLSAHPSASTLVGTPSSHRASGPSAITVELALAQANGSLQATLENLVNERNQLQNENASLWKHLEKTRASALSYKNDLTRIRAERDRALSLLEAARGGDDRQKYQNQRDTSIPDVSTTLLERSTPQRHHSDTGGSKSLLDSPSSHTPPQSLRRPSLPLHLPSDFDISSTSSHDTTSVGPNSLSTAITPPTPTKPSRPNRDHGPSTPPPRVSSDSVVTSDQSHASSTLPTSDVTNDRVQRNKFSSQDTRTPLIPHNPPPIVALPNILPARSSAVSPNLTAPEPTVLDPKRLARSSRISLPDEASQYITNMVESPIPSPAGGPSRFPQSNVVFVSESSHSASRGSTSVPGSPLTHPESHHPPFRVEKSADTDALREAAFLDMDDEEDDDETPDPAIVVPAVTSSPENILAAPTVVKSSSKSSPPSAGLEALSTAQESRPLQPPRVRTRFSSDTLEDLAPGPMSPESQPIASSLPPEQHRFEYKATRLTTDDLPHTKVHVEGSNIRPNDRGKEVLSFIILVQTANKEWRIEKLYSDVLALDGRVRVAAGKSHAKKIGTLPDSKLFKDNAPAKVDLRKLALETYFQTLIEATFRKKDDICMFFSTGLVRNERAPVHHAGYKEGYLTKRSKNFGGFLRWKTRYFVLQSPVLEYYESRGGQHLGSIQIANAQIGRQQKPSSAVDDENAFRHAFLIIEAKRTSGTPPVRHVLCAESDAERDSWVEALVRYVSGSADDGSETVFGTSSAGSSTLNVGQYQGTRSSTSSSVMSPTETPPPQRAARRGISKDDITKISIPNGPIPSDRSTGSAITSPEMGSSSDMWTSSVTISDGGQAARPAPGSLVPGSSHHVALSSSVPTNMDAISQSGTLPRASSELGHYPDMTADNRSDARASTSSAGAYRPHRASYHPSLSTVKAGAGSTDSSPSPDAAPTQSGNTKVKTISGPLNGTPIPAGYKFGVKDTIPGDSGSERERKAKSGRFWGFGKHGAPGGQPAVTRVVLGVPITDALAVAQIANLPAIVFRCIEYLEKKKADQEEGIYRLSGSSAVMKALKDRFNTEGDVDLLSPEEYWDPHAIAGLLKSYFRELPTSILTHDLHFRFLKVIDLTDPQERVTELSHLIAALPLPNYCLLRALTAHLILIVQNASVNKMTMRNVGIVFSPTLGIPAGVFSLMLGEFTRVFNVDADFVETGLNEPLGSPDDMTPRSRDKLPTVHPSKRNSLSYAEASADRLLGLSGRSLTAPDEGDSDDMDDIIIQDDSGTETDATPSLAGSDEGKEEEAELHSPPDTPGPRTYLTSTNNGDNGSLLPRTPSHSAVVAANRGLQIHTERARNPAVGLPVSPRPMPASSTNNPSPRAPRGPNSGTYPRDANV